MLFILCFVYCFFAVVLGTYLGFELVSVRRAERVARTIAKAARRAQASMAQLPSDSAATEPGEPNYFNAK
jgi:hypothetical protein